MCIKTLDHVHLDCHLSAESGHSFGSLGGRQEAPVAKLWAILTGIGSLAFAYEFSIVLLEIQVSTHLNFELTAFCVDCVLCSSLE